MINIRLGRDQRRANPNHVSKVVLPVTGRVVSVLVKLGDAVAKDQPLLTLQSPDADAAMSAYISARASDEEPWAPVDGHPDFA